MLFKLALPPLSREEQCLFDNTTNGSVVCQLKKVKLEEDRLTARAVFFMEFFQLCLFTLAFMLKRTGK